MGRREHTPLTDDNIQKWAADAGVGCLRDDDHKAVRFRYLQDRTRGAWDVRRDNGDWQKVGDYPALNCAAMLKRYPLLREQLSVGSRPVVSVDVLVMTHELLRWYRDYQLRKGDLSKERKAGIKSIINTRLLPCLHDIPLADLGLPLLSRLLVTPMGETCSTAYIRQVYWVLNTALRRAVELGLLEVNPLLGARFTFFCLGKMKVKAARLHAFQLDDVVSLLVERFESHTEACMLALVMLMHGTRVGETRRLRWTDIHWDEGVLIIPAEQTKTRTRHVLPLTAEALALFQRYRDLQKSRPSVYLFPGVRGRAVSAAAANGWFRELSGGVWSSHDLRKLARGCWQKLGIGEDAAERLLNHTRPELINTYMQEHVDAEMREGLELWHGPGTVKLKALDLGERFGLRLRPGAEDSFAGTFDRAVKTPSMSASAYR
jgi:integrase